MRCFADNLICSAVGLGLCLSAVVAQAEGTATIRRISLIAGSTLELEIAASGPVNPQAKVIQGPDRLILDFPNTVPAGSLHKLAINRGDVLDARVGLFSSNPPVTRVVLDLKSPQPYQLFPAGNTVVVKFTASAPSMGSNRMTLHPAQGTDDPPETIISIERTPIQGSNRDRLIQAAQPTPAAVVSPASAPPPPVEVSFVNGMLSIRSTKASLAEVLAQVHRLTGAEIVIPPGAESDEVFTNLGPGAPKEVLASLLNGSRFNFIVIGSEHDPGGIRQVVLTPKQGGAPQAVIYPCGSSQPSLAQAAPGPEPPVQAMGAPLPPEQAPDSGDPPPPPPQQ
ncbi:MAG: AMIN domain-containing protein [Terriglobales bacterium]